MKPCHGQLFSISTINFQSGWDLTCFLAMTLSWRCLYWRCTLLCGKMHDHTEKLPHHQTYFRMMEWEKCPKFLYVNHLFSWFLTILPICFSFLFLHFLFSRCYLFCLYLLQILHSWLWTTIFCHTVELPSWWSFIISIVFTDRSLVGTMFPVDQLGATAR